MGPVDDTGYVTFNFDKDGELIDICSYSKSWNRLSQEHMIEQITEWIEEKNASSNECGFQKEFHFLSILKLQTWSPEPYRGFMTE